MSKKKKSNSPSSSPECSSYSEIVKKIEAKQTNQEKELNELNNLVLKLEKNINENNMIIKKNERNIDYLGYDIENIEHNIRKRKHKDAFNEYNNSESECGSESESESESESDSESELDSEMNSSKKSSNNIKSISNIFKNNPSKSSHQKKNKNLTKN